MKENKILKNEKDTALGNSESPVVVRLSHLENVIMPLNGFEAEIKLDSKGVMIDNTRHAHYGFTIIVDYNNNQVEQSFRTDGRIIALQMENGKLAIYEENRVHPWLFDKSGKAIFTNDATVNFHHEKCDMTFNSSGHLEQNDGLIKIIIDKVNDRVTIDANGDELPIVPGAQFGNEYHGINFEIIKKSSDGIETIKTSYLTEDALCGIEAEVKDKQLNHEYTIDEIENIKVYEREKYHPWIFTSEGELVEKSSYNVYSRRDIEAYENKYGKRLSKDTYHQ